MEIDPKLVILVISNQINGNELFRVHIHEHTIRFDEKFQKGIDKNRQLKLEIDSLNSMWESQKIEQNHIFPLMLDIMTRYGDYMKDFFFDETELDSSGQFIENKPKEIKAEAFFESLKKQKLIKKVTKKEFQANIKSMVVAEKYVEKYAPKSNYYHYQLFRKSPIKENWYFMENSQGLCLCFVNK